VIKESERRVKEEAESIRRLGARRARETRRRGKEGFTADIIGAIGTGISGAARFGPFSGGSDAQPSSAFGRARVERF